MLNIYSIITNPSILCIFSASVHNLFDIPFDAIPVSHTHRQNAKSRRQQNSDDISRETEIVLDDQNLDIVQGQRGRELILFNGFTFSKNNMVGNKTYWACRTRNNATGACKARITTISKSNGLHKIVVTKSEHNHAKTTRMLMKIQRSKAKKIKTEDHDSSLEF